MSKRAFFSNDGVSSGSEYLFILDGAISTETDGASAKACAVDFKEAVEDWAAKADLSGSFQIAAGWIGDYEKKPCAAVDCTQDFFVKVVAEFSSRISETRPVFVPEKGRRF